MGGRPKNIAIQEFITKQTKPSKNQ